jgi:recombination protein RecA
MSSNPKKKVNKSSSSGAINKSGNDVVGILDSIIGAIGSEDGTQILGSDSLGIKIKGVTSTQCATFDAAIGRGGVPRGRLTIIHGPEGCGKTTLALHLAAETQRQGGVAIYIDKEYKLDPDYAAKIGVDVGKLIITQPSYLEKVFRAIDAIIDKVVQLREDQGKKIPILIVLDSMNAAITKAEFEGEWEDHHYAPQARVYSSSLPKIMPKISKEDIALVWISQIRTNIGISYGNPTDISGGKAPKFYASLIMSLARKTAIAKDGEKIGNEVELICSKNQIAPPFKKAMCNIIYGVGIDKNAAMVDQAIRDGIIVKKGSWYTWRGESVGQGIDSVVIAFVDNEWMRPLTEEVVEKNGWEQPLI